MTMRPQPEMLLNQKLPAFLSTIDMKLNRIVRFQVAATGSEAADLTRCCPPK